MKMLWLRILAVSAAMFCLSSWAFADDGHKNHFASILLDGKKIGNVHYTVKHNEKGELEELRTKASLSMLGVKLYDFSQQLQEQWSGGELQTMSGNTNDDGKAYAITLKRTPKEYEASRNDKPLTLPHDAFPISLWHYAISQQSLLFDLSDLSLLTVTVSGHKDTVEWGGETVQAERFDFAGDWKGSVWFDQNKKFVKAEYESGKRLVTVVMDP
jgi:hypothetical protein